MHYIIIENNKIISGGDTPIEGDGFINYEPTDELYNAFIANPDYYMWNGQDVVLNPDWEEIQKQKEKERVGNLTMTKRIFALGLQEYGISYSQLKQIIAQNEQAQLEWDLCVELERKNPLLDIMAAQVGITSEQLDNMFKRANGEE